MSERSCNKCLIGKSEVETPIICGKCILKSEFIKSRAGIKIVRPAFKDDRV